MTKSLVWWERALEYRSLADETHNPARRASYMSIAEDCARMARRLEEVDAIIAERSQPTAAGAELAGPDPGRVRSVL
jgi:hypothetical protein